MDNYTKAKETVQTLNKAFPKVYFDINPYYHGEWEKAFIQKDGVSIGRITFHKGEVYYIKQYKPGDYEYDENDNIFYLLDYYLATGRVYKDIDKLHEKAVKFREEDLAAKTKWRAENPIKVRLHIDSNGKVHRSHRKKLYGRNVRYIMTDFIREEMALVI